MMLSKWTHFFNVGLWEIQLRDMPFLKAIGVKALRLFMLAWKRFNKDECPRNASALTYYSLLNIVPLAAVVFAIAKGFGLEKLIQKQILQMAEKANWQAEMTNQIITFSQSLLEQVRGGLIAGVGVILLLWTIISILGKIEESFNAIWEVRRSRTLVRKFTDYISIMVLTPILFLISNSMTIFVASGVKSVVNKIALLGMLGSLIFFLLKFLPYLSIWMLFILLYLTMPNTRIPTRTAILGGIVGGTIFQIVQWAYIKFQIGVTSYGAIYGSFAALPLLLGWIQLSWMIVLFGAEIAFASENIETFGFHPDYSRLSFASKKVLALRIFHHLIKNFSMGEPPLSAKQISQRLEIPPRLVRQILFELTSSGLVVETAKGSKNVVSFQPGRTIEKITIKTALEEYEKIGITHPLIFQSDETEKISGLLKAISDEMEKASGNVLLKEI